MRVRVRCFRVPVHVVFERPVGVERSGLLRLVEATGGAPSAPRSRRHRRAYCIPLLRGTRPRRPRHHYAKEV